LRAVWGRQIVRSSSLWSVVRGFGGVRCELNALLHTVFHVGGLAWCMPSVSRSNPSEISAPELFAEIELRLGALRESRFNQPEAALEGLLSTGVQCEALEYTEGQAAVMLLRSFVCAQLGNGAEAARLEAEGLACAERAGLESAGLRSGELRLALSIVYGLRGEVGLAQRALTELLNLARGSGHLLWEAYAQHDLALNFQLLGDNERAMEGMFECLRLQRAANDAPNNIAFTLSNLGTIHAEQGDLTMARASFEEGLTLCAESADPASQAMLHVNLALTLTRLGEAEGAEGQIDEARSLYERIGSLPGVGACEDALSTLRAAQGRTLEALEHFERATPLVTLGLPPEGLAARQIRWGKWRHVSNPDDSEAIQSAFTGALKLARDHHARRLEMDALLALMEFFEDRSDFEAAYRHSLMARDLEGLLFSDTSDRRTKRLTIQFETERAIEKATLERARNQELQNLNAALETANIEKAALLEELRLHNRQLEHLSQRDPLTELFNRRALEVRFQELSGRYANKPICLAVGDIDHFKLVNDRFSHAVGDEVLRIIARLMLDACRGADLVSRHGGEEFVLVLPDTDGVAGERVCERIRRAVEDFHWENLKPNLRVTISFGLAEGTLETGLKTLIARGDAKLYEAKQAGRNRVVL
jgi:diguanylate cyclase (GGDEF)-like protein